MIVPLFKSSGDLRNVAVLTPNQWHLIESYLNTDNKIRGNFLLYTAMRIAEARYVSEHPECFRETHAAIFLPRVKGLGKLKSKQKDRTILLSTKGVKAVKDLLENKIKFPSYQAMEGAFKRAAKEADVDTQYITSKMFRKTYLSWLMAITSEKQVNIALSVGHDTRTMSLHYLQAGFRKEDLKDMKEEIAGWGEPV
jgi:integrase